MKQFILLLTITFFSCTTQNKKPPIQEGDILFQNLNCGELCDAIEAVTEGIDGKDFSHCSIVVRQSDTLKVVEAIGGNVQINSLQNFFKRSGDTFSIKNITIARVKNQYKNIAKNAQQFALQQVGKQYDDEFILNNGKWYCSELLYEAFKQANNNKDFFSLHPMTFKDPKTQQFFPAWIKYYKELNKDIPEGKSGLNPGSISRDNKLEIIQIEKFEQ